jgi:hypothetical protein
MGELSIVTGLFVSIVQSVTEVDFFVSAHMRVKTKVIGRTAVALSSGHDVSLEDNAHWHV